MHKISVRETAYLMGASGHSVGLIDSFNRGFFGKGAGWAILLDVNNTFWLDILSKNEDKRLQEWIKKERLIQSVFDVEDADRQEMYLTGITPDKWDKIMGEEIDPDMRSH